MSEPRLAIELADDGRRIELPRAGVLSIGSGRADLVVRGSDVGEVHCVIGRVKGGGWAVKDLGTPAGTLLDGARVEGAKLEAGQRLSLGGAQLRVVDLDAALAAPAPAGASSAASAGAAPSPAARAAVAALGEVSGYRIERPLGRGGMGQVFLAEQESLRRKVALKVLAEKFSADADFVRRFQAEARAAAALNHPNIVTVHDVWAESGRHFLAMEFMSGGTLEERVAREGRLPARDVVDILTDAAKGLVFAELRGIVHRDIKPANLMVNEVGTTKIADLGLATQLEAEATEEAGGKIFGTPHFIAPEQARGERVDGRADLYALGATAYRLLSGHTPFEGATTREILRGHLFEVPRPLSEFVPDVPPALSALVSRLLAKKPEERVASAGTLLTELERIKLELLHGAPSGATAAGGPRLGLVVAAVVAAALGGGLWWFLGRATTPAPGPVAGSGARTPTQAGSPEAPDGVAGAPAPETPPRPVEPAPFVDDDSALARLEREAERAFADLSASLDEEARALELARLAREYAGTTAAGRFQAEAAAIRERLAQAAGQAQASNEQVAAALTQLRAAPDAQPDARSLAARLTLLAGVPIDEALRAQPEFVSGARSIWLETLAAAAAGGEAALQAADARQASGEFEGLRAELESARADLREDTWPALPADLDLAGSQELARLRDARERLNGRVAGLDDLETRWLLERERADRAALAASLHSGRAFERELRDLELAACRARLAQLESSLPLESSRSFARELRADLAAAGLALEALGSSTWKRRTVNDPRTRGRANREAVGADAKGLLLKDGEGVESLPWAAFGGRPTELHQLFFERLTRSFTPEELRGIAALMRTAAVLQAIEEGSEVLEPDNSALLTEAEGRHMLEGFELARPWAEQAGQLEALEAEYAAAQLGVVALRAVSDQHPGTGVTALERLLAEHRETLLVRLISDGGLVSEVDPPLPELPPERLSDPAPVVAAGEEGATPVEATAPEQPGQDGR